MIATFLLNLWNRYFGETLRKIEADSLADRQSAAGRGPDWKTVAVLLTVAVCLTLQNYTGHPTRVKPAFEFIANAVGGPESETAVRQKLDKWANSQSDSLAWWAACAVLNYTLIPLLVIKLGFRESIGNYGTKVRGIHKSWPIYAAFVAVMVPLVAIFSGEDRFQETYPFYRVSNRDQINGDFFRWELLYALQFVALEFFFRGFIVHGTKHRFGLYSVFVMTIPYCMIHYQKPAPEAAASIIAGVALGFVSLTTRSVWLGAALHISVAWSMDTATLTRRGLLW